MFGFFKKKEPIENEEIVDVAEVQVADDEVLAQREVEQAKKDAEQDRYIKELEKKVSVLTQNIKDLKAFDKKQSKTDSNQEVRLGELSRNYKLLEDKVMALDVQAKVTVKNLNTIKVKMSRMNIETLPSNEKEIIEDVSKTVDTIINRYK